MPQVDGLLREYCEIHQISGKLLMYVLARSPD